MFDALKNALENHYCLRTAAVLINANAELSRGLLAVPFRLTHGLHGVMPTFLCLERGGKIIFSFFSSTHTDPHPENRRV